MSKSEKPEKLNHYGQVLDFIPMLKGTCKDAASDFFAKILKSESEE